MIKYLKEYRFYILLFLFILIPVLGIDTSTRSPREYRFYDRIIIGVTAPIQTAISWSLDSLTSLFQNYIFLLNTRTDNRVLLEENRRMLNTIASLRETQQENIRLKRLLQFEEKLNEQSVVARVIATDVSTEFRALRINRGESSGIRKNMAVVTNEGVVGRVIRTTRATSDVVTVLDLLSAVDAIDERSRARGVVEGKTDDTCQLRYTVRTDDIQQGDTLITSGLGGIFPKAIPIGSVSHVVRKPFGISQEVEVKPSVDFSKLEEVLIITQVETELLPLAEKATDNSAPETPLLKVTPPPTKTITGPGSGGHE